LSLVARSRLARFVERDGKITIRELSGKKSESIALGIADRDAVFCLGEQFPLLGSEHTFDYGRDLWVRTA
jgi:hypothetical protein